MTNEDENINYERLFDQEMKEKRAWDKEYARRKRGR